MIGCAHDSRSENARQAIGDKVIIILASEPDPNSNVISIQDFIRDGEEYVPFFSSKSEFDESTKDVDLGKPVYEIDRRLFVQTVRSQDTLVLNPGLKSEMTFTGEELKLIFPEPFPQ